MLFMWLLGMGFYVILIFVELVLNVVIFIGGWFGIEKKKEMFKNKDCKCELLKSFYVIWVEIKCIFNKIVGRYI